MAQALAGIEILRRDRSRRSFATVENRMETEAVEVAVAVARKLCTELMAAQPLTEITALVSDCFRHLTSTPHIVVRINDSSL